MQRDIIVIAHDIRSAHNIGALFRTCDGIGVSKLFISGYSPYPLQNDDTRLPHQADKIARQIHKTALNAENTVNWEFFSKPIDDLVEQLHHEEYVVCALEQSDSSILISEFNPPKKIALILGREVEGIEDRLLSLCDHILEIPMLGKKESHNVVQAAAMALYRLRFLP